MSSATTPLRPSGQGSRDKNRPEFVQSVDTTGLLCPLPILRAKKALQTLESGQVLRVFTTDKKAVKDFQAFCQQTAHALLQQDVEEDQSAWHYIRKR